MQILHRFYPEWRMNGAIIMFDIARRQTFEDVPFWIQKICETEQFQGVIMLIGNKIDLFDTCDN